MPTGSEWKKREWGTESRLVRILFCLASVAIVIATILSILVLKQMSKLELTADTCNTPGCLIEASQIASYVNPALNPCDNLYKFACGNFLKNAHGNEQLGVWNVLRERSKRQLLEIYEAPCKDRDHKMLKTVMKLYKACRDIKAIEKDNLRTLKEVFKKIGGWPVLEGPSWNETNFEWVKATYKLRELGYYYAIFMEVNVIADLANSTGFHVEVEEPFMSSYRPPSFDEIRTMTDIVARFGSKSNREEIVAEMTDVFKFRRDLERHKILGKVKCVVEECDQSYSFLNLLEFINTILGPTASIAKNDTIRISSHENLRSWVNLIERTPKRVQANFMMWGVLEKTFEYLTDDLWISNKRDQRGESSTRAEFCLKKIQERFVPSPAQVMCDRKYLPMAKRNKVEAFVLHIKSAFVKALEKVQWMDEKDKRKAVETAKAIKLVIGAPGNYFADKILDDLDVDMVDTESDSFLSLIAQAKRNRQTTFYNKLKKDNIYERWYIQSGVSRLIYDDKHNEIFIPTVSTKSMLYDENRPQYLNYGAMGTYLAYLFSGILTEHIKANDGSWSNQTKQEAYKKLECLEKEIREHDLKFEMEYQHHDVLQLSMGVKVAYSAYEQWTKQNGHELKLIGTDYSTEQLFWISLASTFCSPLNNYVSLNSAFVNHELYISMLYGIVPNHPNFTKDFQCPAGSKMILSNECQLL